MAAEENEPYDQQGDAFLYGTINGGDLTVKEGLLQMTGGLPTAAYLSLFGGNFEDDGRPTNNQSWWGNTLENDPAGEYHSQTQNLLESLPATPSNLRRIEEAAKADLQWLLDKRIASSVAVVATMPGLNRIKLTVDIFAFGEENRFEYVEAWRAGGFEPILQPLTPEWRVLEDYRPRLTEDGFVRFKEGGVFDNSGRAISALDPYPLPVTIGDFIEVSRPRVGEMDKYDSFKVPAYLFVPVQATDFVPGVAYLSTGEEVLIGGVNTKAVTANALFAAVLDMLENRIKAVNGLSAEVIGGYLYISGE